MSFKVEYDRNGNIKSAPPISQEIQEPIEQSVEMFENPIENDPILAESTTAEIPVAAQQEVVEAPKSEAIDARISFRQLREKAERAERERNELAKRLQDLEKPKEDAEIYLGPDDLAEGKHLQQMAKQNKKQADELKRTQDQLAQLMIEQQIRAKYPDFDKIVSDENIETLNMMHPEIAQTLADTPNYANKALSAYKMIKSLGIAKDDVYQVDRERAAKNIAKPKPASSIAPQSGNSPLAQANAFANGLTQELKNQYYKEMMDARKNL